MRLPTPPSLCPPAPCSFPDPHLSLSPGPIRMYFLSIALAHYLFVSLSLSLSLLSLSPTSTPSFVSFSAWRCLSFLWPLSPNECLNIYKYELH